VSLLPRRGFPLRAPTWPDTVPRPPAPSRTGVDFDTAWARRPAARLARAALVDLAIRPAVHALTSPTVDGRDRLDALEPPVIFAANHHSHLDTGLLLSLLPERFRRKAVVAAAADYFFDRRAKGTLHALAFGAVPMERTRVNRRSADMATDLLADGWSLVIFPEGGRSPDGWAQAFRGGAAYLAVRTGRPVVPVYLDGTRQVWPKGQRLPRAGLGRPGGGRPPPGRPPGTGRGRPGRRTGHRLVDGPAAGGRGGDAGHHRPRGGRLATFLGSPHQVAPVQNGQISAFHDLARIRH